MLPPNNNVLLASSRVTPHNFNEFVVARQSHHFILLAHSLELYGQVVDLNTSDLKRYQDLLVYAFIKENIKPGSRLLEVGGGDSRILRALESSYECWNIDPLQALGNGPREIKNCTYRLILDYMGNFNIHLPNEYFDFVFSISALEHSPEDEKVIDAILRDIDRVLRKGSYSLHLLDAVFGESTAVILHPFIQRAFQTFKCMGELPKESVIAADPDTYFMGKAAYDRGWKSITGSEYEQFGRPTSIQVLWQKE